jgi:AcrR family transcriptional regulator
VPSDASPAKRSPASAAGSAAGSESASEPRGSLADRAVERSLEQRRASYAREVQQIIDATYEVIERSGSLDPPMRDILRRAGLSTPAFYRHFRSKDELLVVLLDDGRRRLAGYLEHRMAKARSPAARVRAWIEGVLAQAADPDAARRTRPFLANLDRLAEQYGAEQRQSVELLIDLLVPPVRDLKQLTGGVRRGQDRQHGPSDHAVRRDAAAIYHLVIAVMHHHVRERSQPAAEEVEHLVGFCLAALASRTGGGAEP